VTVSAFLSFYNNVKCANCQLLNGCPVLLVFDMYVLYNCLSVATNLVYRLCFPLAK